MQKILYFLLGFIFLFAFFIPSANALTVISDTATIFDGPPPSVFDGPPSTIFDINGVSSNQITGNQEIKESEPSNSNISNSQSMQKTGFPLSLMIFAILLIFGGFIGYKRR